MKSQSINCAGKILNLSSVQIMGILNVTPDSFSDGGLLHDAGALSVQRALARAEVMVKAGASIIDVGGESTRPGAKKVSVQEELDRVIAVVEAIHERLDVIVSVDTSSPEVMKQGAAAGAGLINDVRALEREGALQAAAKTGLPICLMHMQGQPQTMQDAPAYKDVVETVLDYFKQRIDRCLEAGIKRENLMLDPGFGFGKTLSHNLTLLARLSAFNVYNLPLLVGVSRKSMIAHLLGERRIEERLPASLAMAHCAVERGAHILRVHDVQETADAIRMVEAIKAAK